MESTPAPSTEQRSIPITNLEEILANLTTIAGQLEDLACTIAEQRQAPSCAAQAGDVVSRIEALLTASIVEGTEAFPALTLAEWLVENMAVDGVHVSVTQVRRLLPSVMGRLFNSKLSCSVKDKDGRVVRGYRGLALRDDGKSESGRA